MSQAMACDRRWKMRRLLTLTAVAIVVWIVAGVLQISGVALAPSAAEAAVALVALLMIGEGFRVSLRS